MIWLILLVVSFVAAIFVTDFLARQGGRLEGMREAEQRNRQQERWDYERGRMDTIRDATVWLRENGSAREARTLPTALLRANTHQKAAL